MHALAERRVREHDALRLGHGQQLVQHAVLQRVELGQPRDLPAAQPRDRGEGVHGAVEQELAPENLVAEAESSRHEEDEEDDEET